MLKVALPLNPRRLTTAHGDGRLSSRHEAQHAGCQGHHREPEERSGRAPGRVRAGDLLGSLPTSVPTVRRRSLGSYQSITPYVSGGLSSQPVTQIRLPMWVSNPDGVSSNQ